MAMGEHAKVLIKNIILKRDINPRFEVDSDYIEELANSNHWPVVVVNKKMLLIDINIVKNLNTTLITRVIKLDYVSARELAKLPQNKFFACASTGKGKLIISGDKHLLDVCGYQGIKVLKPKEFIEQYLND